MVSIVTVYYNRENFVIDSIQSLLNQSYSDIEIIAIDDGSTDGTLDKLMSFNDSRLKVITHDNMGFVKSIIKAVKYATGDFIAIHGSGDFSYETRIERQVELLQSRPEVGLVSCYVENVNMMTGNSYVDKAEIDPSGDVTKQLIQANFLHHGEVMFRRSVYTQAGGYREFFKFAQDHDLWLRMSLFSQIAIVPETLYRRYRLPDSVSASIDKTMMQLYFCEMCIQCIELRMRNQPDLIDRYGMQASFFWNRTGRLARILWRFSLTALYRRGISDALSINRKSMDQKITLYNVCTHLGLLALNRSKLLKRIMAKSLNKGRSTTPYASEQQKQTA
ncbi:glycosyltransferase [Paenibacillus mendelii]|uniref:Glycosyltransferase n=1 Tax=Paenibacillus mendelii TaxID=206163 RepID=A0ABV6JJ68_9BACL|nr:glycosyltransferase [Paenibacillus mendelii]MCQ6558890.1 glycosyltransferase [Paenibacillus mendelii]